MSAAGGNQASRLDRAAPAPPADPTATILARRRDRSQLERAVPLRGAQREECWTLRGPRPPAGTIALAMARWPRCAIAMAATREVWGRHWADERSGIDPIVVAEIRGARGAVPSSHVPLRKVIEQAAVLCDAQS